MAVFALMLVMLIRGKIRYIDLMEQEIQILKRRGPGLPDYGKGEG